MRLIDGDKDFFKEAKCERFVCHFFRENNWPCKVMDKHLNEMAPLHLETKFARINAEKAPFVTEKLRIWMLPSLAVCKDGKIIDYIVGFDELGGSDDFPMSRLRMAIAARGGINWDGDDGPKAPPPPGGEKVMLDTTGAFHWSNPQVEPAPSHHPPDPGALHPQPRGRGEEELPQPRDSRGDRRQGELRARPQEPGDAPPRLQHQDQRPPGRGDPRGRRLHQVRDEEDA